MDKNGGEVNNDGDHRKKDELRDVEEGLSRLKPPRINGINFYKAEFKRIDFIAFRHFLLVALISHFPAVITGLTVSMGPEATVFAFDFPHVMLNALGHKSTTELTCNPMN